MKIGVYTSGNAGRVGKILQSQLFDTVRPSISWIIHDGNPTTVAETVAQRLGISFSHVSYPCKTSAEKSAVISDTLLQKGRTDPVEYIFCFGNRILTGDLLTVYRNRIINFHPSILPAFKGVNAIDQALNYPALISGNTAHFVDEGVDTGPIIMHHLFPLPFFEGYDQLLDAQIAMFYQIYIWLKDGRVLLSGRKVTITAADYSIGTFVPGLEIPW